MRTILSALVLTILMTGCQPPDTRMTIQQFLQMEEGHVVDATLPPGATTQPAPAKVIPWDQGPYELGPGDVISISLSELEALGLTGTYQVRITQAGTVTLDTIGEIRLAGLTFDEAETAIHDAYVPKYIKQTQVTISVIEYRMMDVMVLGHVAMPQPVELRGDKSSVLHALLVAGWLTPVASGKITWLRSAHPEEPITFDLTDQADLARAARNGALNNSDVLISERGQNDFVFVQGLVNAPGGVPMPAGTSLSVMQAIAAAGGTLHQFAPKEATLMRRKDNGQVIRVAVDLHRLALGEDPDLALRPGDLVLVPHTVDTRLEEFLAKTLYFRAGIDAVYNPWVDYYFREDLDLRREQISTRDTFSTAGRLGLTPAPPAPAN